MQNIDVIFSLKALSCPLGPALCTVKEKGWVDSASKHSAVSGLASLKSCSRSRNVAAVRSRLEVRRSVHFTFFVLSFPLVMESKDIFLETIGQVTPT